MQYSGAGSVLDYTENLSETGLFIRTDRDLVAGERVALVLSIPQLLDPVELQVEVVRRREPSREGPGGVAVRVPADCAADRARLASLARELGAPRGTEHRARVLVVEDNPLVASMYAAALRRLSDVDGLPALGVEVAEDGASALDRLLCAPPVDLVITDLFMPVVSGILLVERIRAEPSLAGLPVVVITSGGDEERARLEPLGVSLFLRKPVSYEDVAGAVRAVLRPGVAARGV